MSNIRVNFKREKINIREFVKLPSTALQYMVDGLLQQNNRTDFVIDMSTFGDDRLAGDILHENFDNPICVGCAATCAIQQIANKDLRLNHIKDTIARAHYLGFHYEELDRFERAIDAARAGQLYFLFIFFGKVFTNEIADVINKDILYNFTLTSNRWKENLGPIRNAIEYLKSKKL